jgi:import inner membrane translocase subunit TIM21
MFRSPLLSRIGVRIQATPITQFTSRGFTSRGRLDASFALLKQSTQQRANRLVGVRNLCQKKPSPEEPGTEIMVTPYQRVQQASSAGLWLSLAGLASVCAFYIIKELMPTRMNPNSLYSEASDEVMRHTDLVNLLGSPLKSYGRDHHGRKEGRRNFIEHVEMPLAETGEPSLRIRFNVEGPYGVAEVYASVVKGMPAGEWLYLILKVKNTGKVMTLHDQRQTRVKKDDDSIFDPLMKLVGK